MSKKIWIRENDLFSLSAPKSSDQKKKKNYKKFQNRKKKKRKIRIVFLREEILCETSNIMGFISHKLCGMYDFSHPYNMKSIKC